MELIIIFLVSFIGAIYSSLVGGASLITIPVLILLGINPTIAIATNRVGMIGQPLGSWYKFHINGLINYKIGSIIGIFALIGSIIGANIVLNINEEVLKKVIGIFTILILAIILLKPHTGLKPKKFKIKTNHYIIASLIAFCIGVYGGFYGAGAGTFFSYLLIFLFGQTFLNSAGTRKIAGFLVNTSAAIVFIINKSVIYEIAILMIIASMLGAYVGSSYAEKLGNKNVKWLFVLIVLIMSIKLLL